MLKRILCVWLGRGSANLDEYEIVAGLIADRV